MTLLIIVILIIIIIFVAIYKFDLFVNIKEKINNFKNISKNNFTNNKHENKINKINQLL